MTKEEILADKCWSMEYPHYLQQSDVYEAMDEYSREVAIDFDEWKFKNNWLQNKGNSYWYNAKTHQTQLTSGQLFDIYKQENI